jgi:hypothetical protein
MKQEEKDLLLKDLCARLPYGVKVQSYSYEDDIETVETLYNIDSDGYMSTLECDTLKNITKPYLFPLSSLTEEQYEKWKLRMCNFDILYETPESYDYLYENHIDIRGLIPKGLANDATGLNIY